MLALGGLRARTVSASAHTRGSNSVSRYSGITRRAMARWPLYTAARMAARRGRGKRRVGPGANGLSIPNLISLARILLVPVVVWAITAGEMQFAFLLFVAAGISDAVDGFLAKRFG